MPRVEESLQRAFEIYVRYRRAVKWARKDRYLQSKFRIAMVIVAALAVVVSVLDLALWNREEPPTEISGFLPGNSWFAALILLYFFNSWMIVRFLAWSTLRDNEFRLWVRLVRRVAAGIPIVGLWTIVLWRWLARERPSWALRPGGEMEGLHGTRRYAILPARSTWLGSSIFANLFITGNVMTALLLTLNAAQLASDDLPALKAVSAALHILGFGFMLYAFVLAAREMHLSVQGTWVFSTIPFCWLVPIPFFPLLAISLFGLCDVYLSPLRRAQETLVYQAYDDARKYVRQSLWVRLEGDVRRLVSKFSASQRLWRWVKELERPKRLGRVETRTLRLCRWKTVLIAPEAALFSWVVRHLTVEQPGGTAVGAALGLLFWMALALGSTGCLSSILLRAMGLRQEPGEWQRILALAFSHLSRTQLALAAGLWIGEGLAREDRATVAAVVSWGGVFLALQFFLRLPSFFPPLAGDSEEDDRSIITLLLLAVGLVAFGGSLDPAASTGEIPWRLLWIILWSAPILGVVTGWFHLSWLHHACFPTRSSPPQEGSKQTSFLPRSVTLTVLSPLGGLAVPFWIFLQYAKLR